MQLNSFLVSQQFNHPNNLKRGGVCIYVKVSLATRVCNISTLNECAIIEITLNNKKGFIILIYRSPSQTADEFEEFMLYLDEILHN